MDRKWDPNETPRTYEIDAKGKNEAFNRFNY